MGAPAPVGGITRVPWGVISTLGTSEAVMPGMPLEDVGARPGWLMIGGRARRLGRPKLECMDAWGERAGACWTGAGT